MSEEQVLSRLKQTVFAYFFSVDILRLEAHFCLGLHASREDGQELHLVFSEVGRRLSVVHLEELRLDQPMLQLLVLDL